MGLADKQAFLRDLEERLGKFVPANDLPKILAEVGDSLHDYSLRGGLDAGEDTTSWELLKYYLDAKRADGRAESTISRYEYVLNRLLDDVGVPFARMTVYHLRSYNTSEKKRGIKASTLEGQRSIYADFFRWLRQEGLIQNNPMQNMPSIKTPKVKRKPFSSVEMRKLERAAGASGRNRAIVEFLHASGCRISEVCSLNRTDIDFQAKKLTVIGKGSKERTVYLTDVALMFLQEYLDSRKDSSPALFPGKGTERMKPDGIRHLLVRIGEKAGVENVHPHRFRRTLATELNSAGMPIQEIAAVLGHDKLETTMCYVCLDQAIVEASYRKYAS